MVWFGLVWFGLVWFGLFVWFGLVCWFVWLFICLFGLVCLFCLFVLCSSETTTNLFTYTVPWCQFQHKSTPLFSILFQPFPRFPRKSHGFTYSKQPALRCRQFAKLRGHLSTRRDEERTHGIQGLCIEWRRRHYPPGEWIHIPPNGKFGKSSTQNAHFWWDMLGNPGGYSPKKKSSCHLKKAAF